MKSLIRDVESSISSFVKPRKVELRQCDRTTSRSAQAKKPLRSHFANEDVAVCTSQRFVRSFFRTGEKHKTEADESVGFRFFTAAQRGVGRL